MYWIEECGWDTSSLGVVRCEWSDNREGVLSSSMPTYVAAPTH